MTIHGRDPETGRALRKDGKPRKKRRTLSPMERMRQLEEKAKAAYSSIGRDIFKGIPAMAGFVSGIGTFRRWIRDARSYGTDEARAKRSEYFQRMLDTVAEKGERAENWLPGAENAEAVISDLYENIGRDIEAYHSENGEAPDSDTTLEIVQRYLTDDVRAVVESANDPENDPFHGLRRGDSEDDSEDSDTL